MSIAIREAKPREKVIEIHGYDELFDNIFALGLTGWINVNQVK